MTLDYEDDFNVIDNSVEVRLTPRGSSVAVTLTAFPQAFDTKEQARTYGSYLASMRRWSLPVSFVHTDPLPGSTLTDDEGVTWTVLQCRPVPLIRQWSLDCINLSLVFTDTIRVERRSTVQNEIGELSDDWVDIGATELGITPFQGKLQPIDAESRERYGRRDLSPDYRVIVPPVAALQIVDGMRLRVGATVYEVLAWDDSSELDFFPVLLVRQFGK